MIRKLLSAAVMMCGAALAASAQDNHPEKIAWGFKAGLDLNLPGEIHNAAGTVDMFDHGYGFVVGPVCNLSRNNFYFEPGLLFFYDSYGFDEITVADSDAAIDNWVTVKPSLYKAGLRVPLTVGYDIPLTGPWALSVFTGPEVSWAFAGKIKAKNLNEEIEDFPKHLFSDYMRRFDCAWTVGVGIPYEHFFLSVRGSFGLVDQLTKKGMSMRENRVAVSFTYFL